MGVKTICIAIWIMKFLFLFQQMKFSSDWALAVSGLY